MSGFNWKVKVGASWGCVEGAGQGFVGEDFRKVPGISGIYRFLVIFIRLRGGVNRRRWGEVV
jgi:hypothetical protein